MELEDQTCVKVEYHVLPRRQLQALCKKYGIPANGTNASMADALASIQEKTNQKAGGDVVDSVNESSADAGDGAASGACALKGKEADSVLQELPIDGEGKFSRKAKGGASSRQGSENRDVQQQQKPRTPVIQKERNADEEKMPIPISVNSPAQTKADKACVEAQKKPCERRTRNTRGGDKKSLHLEGSQQDKAGVAERERETREKNLKGKASGKLDITPKVNNKAETPLVKEYVDAKLPEAFPLKVETQKCQNNVKENLRADAKNDGVLSIAEKSMDSLDLVEKNSRSLRSRRGTRSASKAEAEVHVAKKKTDEKLESAKKNNNAGALATEKNVEAESFSTNQTPKIRGRTEIECQKRCSPDVGIENTAFIIPSSLSVPKAEGRIEDAEARQGIELGGNNVLSKQKSERMSRGRSCKGVNRLESAACAVSVEGKTPLQIVESTQEGSVTKTSQRDLRGNSYKKSDRKEKRTTKLESASGKLEQTGTVIVKKAEFSSASHQEAVTEAAGGIPVNGVESQNKSRRQLRKRYCNKTDSEETEKVKAQAKANADDDAVSPEAGEADAGVGAQAEAEAKTKSEAKVEVEVEVEAGAGADAEVESKVKSKAEAEGIDLIQIPRNVEEPATATDTIVPAGESATLQMGLESGQLKPRNKRQKKNSKEKACRQSASKVKGGTEVPEGLESVQTRETAVENVATQCAILAKADGVREAREAKVLVDANAVGESNAQTGAEDEAESVADAYVEANANAKAETEASYFMKTQNDENLPIVADKIVSAGESNTLQQNLEAGPLKSRKKRQGKNFREKACRQSASRVQEVEDPEGLQAVPMNKTAEEKVATQYAVVGEEGADSFRSSHRFQSERNKSERQPSTICNSENHKVMAETETNEIDFVESTQIDGNFVTAAPKIKSAEKCAALQKRMEAGQPESMKKIRGKSSRKNVRLQPAAMMEGAMISDNINIDQLQIEEEGERRKERSTKLGIISKEQDFQSVKARKDKTAFTDEEKVGITEVICSNIVTADASENQTGLDSPAESSKNISCQDAEAYSPISIPQTSISTITSASHSTAAKVQLRKTSRKNNFSDDTEFNNSDAETNLFKESDAIANNLNNNQSSLKKSSRRESKSLSTEAIENSSTISGEYSSDKKKTQLKSSQEKGRACAKSISAKKITAHSGGIERGSYSAGRYTSRKQMKTPYAGSDSVLGVNEYVDSSTEKGEESRQHISQEDECREERTEVAMASNQIAKQGDWEEKLDDEAHNMNLQVAGSVFDCLVDEVENQNQVSSAQRHLPENIDDDVVAVFEESKTDSEMQLIMEGEQIPTVEQPSPKVTPLSSSLSKEENVLEQEYDIESEENRLVSSSMLVPDNVDVHVTSEYFAQTDSDHIQLQQTNLEVKDNTKNISFETFQAVHEVLNETVRPPETSVTTWAQSKDLEQVKGDLYSPKFSQVDFPSDAHFESNDKARVATPATEFFQSNDIVSKLHAMSFVGDPKLEEITNIDSIFLQATEESIFCSNAETLTHMSASHNSSQLSSPKDGDQHEDDVSMSEIQDTLKDCDASTIDNTVSVNICDVESSDWEAIKSKLFLNENLKKSVDCISATVGSMMALPDTSDGSSIQLKRLALEKAENSIDAVVQTLAETCQIIGTGMANSSPDASADAIQSEGMPYRTEAATDGKLNSAMNEGIQKEHEFSEMIPADEFECDNESTPDIVNQEISCQFENNDTLHSCHKMMAQITYAQQNSFGWELDPEKKMLCRVPMNEKQLLEERCEDDEVKHDDVAYKNDLSLDPDSGEEDEFSLIVSSDDYDKTNCSSLAAAEMLLCDDNTQVASKSHQIPAGGETNVHKESQQQLQGCLDQSTCSQEPSSCRKDSNPGEDVKILCSSTQNEPTPGHMNAINIHGKENRVNEVDISKLSLRKLKALYKEKASKTKFDDGKKIVEKEHRAALTPVPVNIKGVDHCQLSDIYKN